jgi:urocanate hydratase
MLILRSEVEEYGAGVPPALWNDPATDVMRHADANWKVAADCAQKHAAIGPALSDLGTRRRNACWPYLPRWFNKEQLQ